MNLQLTTGKPFCIRCAGCRERFIAGSTNSGSQVYADLDSQPFGDYYCGLCAGEKRRESWGSELIKAGPL